MEEIFGAAPIGKRLALVNNSFELVTAALGFLFHESLALEGRENDYNLDIVRQVLEVHVLVSLDRPLARNHSSEPVNRQDVANRLSVLETDCRGAFLLRLEVVAIDLAQELVVPVQVVRVVGGLHVEE